MDHLTAFAFIAIAIAFNFISGHLVHVAGRNHTRACTLNPLKRLLMIRLDGITAKDTGLDKILWAGIPLVFSHLLMVFLGAWAELVVLLFVFGVIFSILIFAVVMAVMAPSQIDQPQERRKVMDEGRIIRGFKVRMEGAHFEEMHPILVR